MAKLTIEIDMDDPQELWDALYRRIEQHGDEADEGSTPKSPSTPVTYDLLLDPDRYFGEVSDFFAAFIGRE